jgi:hypothetical protein
MAQVNSEDSTATPAPESLQDALFLPTERAVPSHRPAPQGSRDEIDRLIRFLDKTDDYVSRELEESNDDEPSLGWTTSGLQCGHCGGVDDLEAETEHDEDSDPAEPSLGSVGDMHFNQERWASGGRRDLEQDGAESGIGDQDGLDEQLGRQDWQPIFFV